MEEIKLPTSYTITLYDLYDSDNTILDILDTNDEFKALELKDKFLNHWGIYEISAETPKLFKLFLRQVYGDKLNKYLKLLHIWDADFKDLLDETHTETFTKTGNNVDNATGVSNANSVNIDLPNNQTVNNYASGKVIDDTTSNIETTKTIDEKHTRTLSEGFNPITQRVKYAKEVQDIVMQFVMEFKDCFLHIW